MLKKVNRKWLLGIGVSIGVVLMLSLAGIPQQVVKVVPTVLQQILKASVTPARTRTATRTPSTGSTATRTPLPSVTPLPNLPTLTPGGVITPYPSAPLCATHNPTEFHTLWNATLGCHYDHEHGASPFTAQVAAAFPGFDLFTLLCRNEISHCVPSSSMENTHKHGGHKWQVDTAIPCEAFESAQWCVTDSAVQYHWFGDASIEMESRVHTALTLVKVCNPSARTDCGYAFIDQHVDYGQRISQYQGELMPYPDNPIPAYAVNLGPYFTIDRYGSCTGCRASLAFVVSRNANSNGTWTSKATGGVLPFGSTLFSLLIRARDMYQLKDNADNTYPFTFGWLCSPSTNGLIYAPAACRYTNSTTRVHEIAGVIPAEWDNLAGFDTNPTVGRITATGYTTRFGTLGLECVRAEADCHPIQLLNMFVGKYGGALPGSKVSNPDAVSNPSRNVWFCNGIACKDTDAGAVPSGWIGSGN